MAKLNERQKRFVDEYLIDLNATQAAIRAGYSPASAAVQGAQNLRKLNIQTAIEAKLKLIRSELTASALEVEEYLASVMRGQSESEVVVVEAQGDGVSAARLIKKHPDERERLKAAELIARRHSLFDDKLRVELQSRPIIPPEERDKKAREDLARIRAEREAFREVSA